MTKNMSSNLEEESIKLRSSLILNRLKDLFEEDERINQKTTLQALLKIGQTAYKILYENE